jgi:SurA N-terminal domain
MGRAVLAVLLAIRWPTLVLVCGLVATGCGAERERPERSTPTGPMVAMVGVEIVSADQVEALLSETERSFDVEGRQFPPPGSHYFLDLRDQAVKHLVDRSARRQEADRLGVKIEESAIDRELDQIDPESLEEAIRRTGITQERLRAWARERLIDQETFRAIFGKTGEGDDSANADRAWRERVRALLSGTRYAAGWKPAERPRVKVPPELEELPDPRRPCDLEDGTYTFLQAWNHGCVEDWGIPVPGRDGPICPEVPVASFAPGGFTSSEVAMGYDVWEVGDDAPSCVEYPPNEIKVSTLLGPCPHADSCTESGMVPETVIELG